MRRIGYLPQSADFSHPADRRKFHFYLRENRLDFEIARYPEYYDLVYVSLGADLSVWRNYQQQFAGRDKKPAVIFNLSDAYLSLNRFDFKTMFRGLYKYAAGQTAHLCLSYSRLLIDMIQASDAVTCASEEQQAVLRRFHDKVHVIPDYFGDDIRSVKSDYSSVPGEINILWEGLSHGNESVFLMLRDILAGISGCKINLHVVTDPVYCRFGGKLLGTPTSALLEKIFSKTAVRVFFYSWHPLTFSSIATRCDLALLPLPHDPFFYNKPPNKLILLWMLGIPVIATATRSYQRVMDRAGVSWTCTGVSDFREKLHLLAGSQDQRVQYMDKVREFIRLNYSKESILKKWNDLAASLTQ